MSSSTSSSKQRTISPFRFRKQLQTSTDDVDVNGNPTTLSPSSNATSYGHNKTQSAAAMPSTPNKLKSQLPPLTPQKPPHSTNSSVGSASPNTPGSARADNLNHTTNSNNTITTTSTQRAKENVTVTVRFRPLSQREIQKGDEVAWYADGDTTVRNEYNSAIAYAFEKPLMKALGMQDRDRVFGPATTTRHVYDVAAQHVVSGAMDGINGTVFAYGVTSSGKTHTMHGDQKSPGIIPLAVKDVFSIIQETPGREFLLRVSYLEIYNEVINDLLDPAGQNLRVREDAQGTYVEGIKEEVVLSPAHCLSLIAAGEEHRHVGSNNFNLLSSRSHTIFTLTIESSPRGDNYTDEEVTLSQLNLIDLAGSESSKTETTGLRRKEGSYINKSLLTLGTVISKLTDGRSTHVPYRDSKLTRLLQSSLSGHGRISLICNVTPASTTNEETHNTLKFAHRAKHVEIHASQNRIMDEKSLIKKYQKEILSLKQELERVKQGMADNTHVVGNQEDLVSLKQQLEAGQVKLQSRLEEEEQAKAALLGRIQRLTKLILVSTKGTVPQNLPVRQGHRRRHSFGEEELAYLPHRRREFVCEDEDSHDYDISLDGRIDNILSDDIFKGGKKTKKRSMLAWFKMKRNENGTSAASFESDNSSTVSPTTSGSSVPHMDPNADVKVRRKSISQRANDVSPVEPLLEPTQAGELFSAVVRGRMPPPTGTTMADQMDLLKEQVKMLAGEVALCTSALKRLTEQAAANPDDTELQSQMKNLKDEILEKKKQMRLIERRIVGSGEVTPNNVVPSELSQNVSKLTNQLNEKLFELEIKSADNRILQEQLQAKIAENTELQTTIDTLHQKLAAFESIAQKSNIDTNSVAGDHAKDNITDDHSNENASQECEAGNTKGEKRPDDASELQTQMLQQSIEIEKLKQENDRLLEEKDALQIQSRKLGEESNYAKELASAAAVELKNLAEEVTRLSYQNSKLASELAGAKDLAYSRPGSKTYGRHRMASNNARRWEDEAFVEELKRELLVSKEREAALESLLAEREMKDSEIRKKLEEAKRREADLENDLAGMWVLIAKQRKGRGNNEGTLSFDSQDLMAMFEEKANMNNSEKLFDIVDLKASLEKERIHNDELELLVSQLKSEDLEGLDIAALEDLSALHVEALTRLCHAKACLQEKLEREKSSGCMSVTGDHNSENKSGHLCKVCFATPSAAVLLPCRHFSLCKSCAVACTECPLCRTTIQDRIITFMS